MKTIVVFSCALFLLAHGLVTTSYAEQTNQSTISPLSVETPTAEERTKYRNLVKTGTVIYACGAPLTYTSIILAEIAINSSHIADGAIVAVGSASLVLNQTGLAMNCINVKRATKHLPENDPIRQQALLSRYHFALGEIFALSSLTVCTIAMPVSINSDLPPDLLLCFGMGLLVIRDIFWTRASIEANQIVNRLPHPVSEPVFSIAPIFSIHQGAGLGLQVRF